MSSGEQGDIKQLIEKLESKDPAARQQSRERLVEMGGPQVTRSLVAELVHPEKQVRWEAAKALGGIADAVAAPALLHALEDEDEDVRWVAGEGLVALRRTGLMTVLSGLTRRARSIEFCKAAHHVLHDLKPKGFADAVAPVLEALETSQPEVTAPPVAYKALEQLRA